MAEYVFHDHTGEHLPAVDVPSADLEGHRNPQVDGRKNLYVTYPHKRVVTRLSVPEGTEPRSYSKAPAVKAKEPPSRAEKDEPKAEPEEHGSARVEVSGYRPE